MKPSRLRAHFVSHLQRRRAARHFLRHFSFELFRHAPVSKTVPPDLARTLTAAATEAPDQLLARLHSHPDGLDAQQAARIRRRTGENVVLHEKPLPAWLHLWHCYVDPFNLLLSVLAAASWYSGDLKATTVIGCMVVLSTLIRFVQERRSSRAADALKAMVSSTATVLRRGADAGTVAQQVELATRLLVPGDVIWLSAGDMIPADIRLIESRDLFISQAVLTGAVSAVNVSMTNNSKVIHEPFNGDWPGMCEDPLTCFSDDFSASTLGSDWVVAQRNGSTLPSLQNGRLRLTQNTTNQATSATFQRLFPGARIADGGQHFQTRCAAQA